MNLKDNKSEQQKKQHKEKGCDKIYFYNPNISITTINASVLNFHIKKSKHLTGFLKIQLFKAGTPKT